MSEPKHIVLFDGVCNLCNSSVQFVVKRDKRAQLHYANLQSKLGQQLLNQHKIDTQKVDSIVFISNGKAYVESTAALKIAAFLEFPYNLLQAFIIVPAFIRNIVYRWIARNRYRWYGKEEVCMMPDPSISARFLDTKAV
jgi:predicted DCC family thiol-disulfide oxidoreductase YuxK